MFRKKKEETIDLSNIIVSLNIPRDTEVEKQIQIIKLNEKDLKYIKYLKPFIENNIDEIVDLFYRVIMIEPSLKLLINQNSSTERLKITLRKHLLEIFEGVVNRSYIEKRIKIANIHLKIGLKPKWYIAAFQEISHSLIKVAKENIKNSDDLVKVINAINKMLNLEQQLVLESYVEKEKFLREEDNKLLKETIVRVTDTSEELAAITEETNASLEELIGQSNNITEIVKKGQEVSTTATEAAKEGELKIKEQSKNLLNMVNMVHKVNEDIQNLTKITKEINKITNIIKSVADETQMLSINAQIEAAHAGEHGKGFSVVATNVGRLSDQTKEAVKNVSSLIEEIEKQSDKVNTSLSMILEAEKQGEESINKTFEQFDVISKSLDNIKTENKNIERELSDFIKVINELGHAFEDVAKTADNLNMLSQKL